MTDFLYSDLDVVARHLPDYSIETAGDGTKVSQELPGFVEFGVVADGVFVPILRRKAAGFFADVQRAKDQAAADQAAQPPDSEPPADTAAPQG